MSNDIQQSTADLLLTTAIADYAITTGQSFEEIRDEIIESGAYDALYDPDTALWTQGPDYFIDFFLKMKESKENTRVLL